MGVIQLWLPAIDYKLLSLAAEQSDAQTESLAA